MGRRLDVIVFVLAIGLFAFANHAAGQAQTTASIVGRVTDESGGILPGVTVTATGPALQVPQVVAVTDAQGDYRLTPLPIGTYEGSDMIAAALKAADIRKISDALRDHQRFTREYLIPKFGDLLPSGRGGQRF